MSDVAPWEKYSKSAAPSGEVAPWDKAKIPDVPINQEMHPEFSTLERWKNKLFSTSPANTVANLKKAHPDMEILEKKGQIIGRMPGEKNYGVLDPDTGVHPIDNPGEFLRDAGDVAYDVGVGIPVNMIQKAGAALGSVLPGPGTLMGAAVAGGGANALGEYVRQKIGQYLDINPEIDSDQIKLAGVIGATSPLVFGADLATPALRNTINRGAQVVQDAMPGFVENIVNPLSKVTPQAMQNTLKMGSDKATGLLQKLVRPLSEEAAQEASRGLLKRGSLQALSMGNRQTVDQMREGFKRLPFIKGVEKEGLTTAIEAKQRDVLDALNEARKASWGKIEKALSDANVNINLDGAKEKLTALLEKYKAKGLNNSAMADKIKEVEETIAKHFGQDAPAEVKQTATGVLDQFGKPVMKEEVVKPAEKSISKVSAEGAYELQKQLGEIADLHKPQNSWMSRLVGKSSGDQELGNAALDARAEVNNAIETATGTIKGLKDEYAQAASLKTDLAPRFKTLDATYETLKNLGRKDKKLLLEKLGAMDGKYGTEALESVKDIEAHSLYSKSAIEQESKAPLISGRNAPMGIVGALIGHSLFGYPGSITGGYIGAKAASKGATRLGMEILNPIVKGSKYIPAATKNSIWNIMMNQNKDE